MTIPRVLAADDSYLVEAQKKLQATFSSLTVVDFRPSPIPELFEINLGSKIIYYHPEKELILFGEIFDKDGTSLTGESLKLFSAVNSFALHRIAKSLRTIIIPAASGEQFEFTDDTANELYLRRMARYILDLRANITPTNAQAKFNGLLSLVCPKQYGIFRERLGEIAADFKKHSYIRVCVRGWLGSKARHANCHSLVPENRGSGKRGCAAAAWNGI